MTPKPQQARKHKLLLIATSIVFAGLILLTSSIFTEPTSKHQAIFLLIAAWWIPFSLLSGNRSRCR